MLDAGGKHKPGCLAQWEAGAPPPARLVQPQPVPELGTQALHNPRDPKLLLRRPEPPASTWTPPMGRSPSVTASLARALSHNKHLLCASFRVGAWDLCGSKAEGIPPRGLLPAGGDDLVQMPRCRLSHGDAGQGQGEGGTLQLRTGSGE